MTVRELINELVKHDPRIQVTVDHKPIKNFKIEDIDDEDCAIEILNIIVD